MISRGQGKGHAAPMLPHPGARLCHGGETTTEGTDMFLWAWIIGLVLVITVIGLFLGRRGGSMDGHDHAGEQQAAAGYIRDRHQGFDL